ncbi:MAG TPA: hypothetical protein VLA93_05950 [Pyrinomonadaceae bacterium]|nr:hypothetical protein [Pyrinomonadaceae bacterium]
MLVVLNAIKFNHDPTSATCDALNIRKNATEDISTPEWRRGITQSANQSLAAYAIEDTLNKTIIVQAAFRRIDPSINSIEIQAERPPDDPNAASVIDPDSTPPRSGNVLGRLTARSVSFGQSDETEYLSFVVADPRIHEVGVSRTITEWHWQYRIPPSKSWVDFQVTQHVIYVVMRTPRPPWTQDGWPSNTQLPWTDILDRATSWAGGSTSSDDAASKITFKVRALENDLTLSYEPTPAWYSHPNFDASSFLDLLNGGLGNGHKLNCSDCATIVSTFANILGCDLSQAQMGWTFLTHPVLPVGRQAWRPFEYNYHEVAWKDPCDVNSKLFDACLKLDRDRSPATEPHPSLQPANIAFGQPHQRLYRFRLAVPPEDQSHSEFPMPKGRPQRRRIAPNPEGSELAHPELLALLKEHYRYSEWENVNKIQERRFIQKFAFPTALFPDWHVRKTNEVITDLWPPITQTLWSGLSHSQQLRVDMFRCDNHAAARFFLMQVLAQFERPTLTKLNGIADIAFVEPERNAVVFALSNLVMLVRNAGRVLIDLIDCALNIHRSLASDTDLTNHADAEELSFAVDRGDRIDLTDVSDRALNQTLQFFTEFGRVFRDQDKLLYEPYESGRDVLRVIGVDQNGQVWTKWIFIDVLSSTS